MIGLGRTASFMTKRLVRAGDDMVGYSLNAESMDQLHR